MRSPLHAILWELWRVTRVEAAWRLSLGIVGGLAALVMFAAAAPNAKDAGAVIALGLIALLQIAGWLSLPKLNGTRPGFPFDLGYTRPVRTAVTRRRPDGVPRRGASGDVPRVGASPDGDLRLSVPAPARRRVDCDPHPGPVRHELVDPQQGLHPSGKRGCRPGQLRSGVISSPQRRSRASDWPPNRWPAIFDFPLSAYALMAVIGLASFGAAVAGVARQRHGGSPAAIPWTAGSAGYPDWIRNLLRFPCPTSSATRAQVWFDLKSSGLAVLTIGLVLAMVNPLLFAVSVPVESIRPVVGGQRCSPCWPCWSSGAMASVFAADKDTPTPARSRQRSRMEPQGWPV